MGKECFEESIWKIIKGVNNMKMTATVVKVEEDGFLRIITNEESLENMKEFLITNPFIALLTKLNDYCWKNRTAATLDIETYKFQQVQEEDKQGWTLVYKGKCTSPVAYINWQAGGCYVETIDEEFKDFLTRNAKECDKLIHGLDDPLKVEFDAPDYWDTVWDVISLRCRLMGLDIM